MKKEMHKYSWLFPLNRTHTGVPQGNGVIGTLLWGGDNVLKITVGRADFWDRRGGLPWREGMSYKAMRKFLEAGDEAGLRSLFSNPGRKEGEPARPTVLPVGRFDLVFPADWRLKKAVLDLNSGAVEASFHGRPKADRILLQIDMRTPLGAIRFEGGVPLPDIRCVPSWEFVGPQLAAVGFEPPIPISEGDLKGWTQMRPQQQALAAAALSSGRDILLCAQYGDNCELAEDSARTSLRDAAGHGGYAAADESARAWWKSYWDRTASIRVPNERLQFLHDYGLYKFAGLTHPDGVAATLQGPWIEEYQLPPWSSDYHFNINVQMCYWPACQANLPHHLLPLFEMIRSWFPKLRENARIFLGIDDGFMLPHAVDDRGVCMGGFWTGAIDHGCTAWVADMMFRYYMCTGDRDFLQGTAYPFMKGAMRVYEEMLEETDKGLALPVSVSPEYRGAAMNAWGRNASFQLACIHRLCENLLAAAGELGEPENAAWRRILEKLPKASLIGEPGKEIIALWDGTPLEESHRHHSHLGGIKPFDMFPPDDLAWSAILRRSMDQWVSCGPGAWSGWCMPWAAMLHTYFDNGAAAELTLETWQRVFTNEGHGTLHDVHFPGYSLMGKSYTQGGRPMEIMQSEAGIAAVSAIQEMLLQQRRGVTVVFGGAPAAWRETGFTGMLADGGFLVSATRRSQATAMIRVESLRGGIFRLRNPWQGIPRLAGASKKNLRIEGNVIHLTMAAGQIVTLKPPRGARQ